VALHGLEAAALYELRSDRTGQSERRSGAELMQRYRVSLPEPRSSDLIVYRKVAD
jgi:hypothetical protein